MTNNASKGFTIVELLITTAILGILSGLSFATFSQFWPDERLKTASRLTVSWLEDVRSLAIQQDTSCIVTIDSATMELGPEVDNPERCDQLNTLNLKREIESMSELSICSQALNTSSACNASSSNFDPIVFTPRGTSNTTVQLRFGLAGKALERCVAVIAPLGMIRSGRASSTGACDYTETF